jgi:selenide,water dikinase
MTYDTTRLRNLLLVGGGHAHVQVLRRLAMELPPRTRITLVVDTPIAVYSGMVPGFVAGQYREGELEIDVLPLARRAGARVVVATATGIDVEQRRLQLDGRPPLAYDRVSFDVGSTVAGQQLPGVREHAFPTRPIGRFVGRLDSILEQARRGHGERLEVVIVGAGAGGVELAFCLEYRLRQGGIAPRVTLLDGGERILRGYPASLVRRVEGEAARRGLRILLGRRVAAVEPEAVVLEHGERLASAVTVWVTGAVSQTLFRDSGLPTDERGFVRVRPTLQVEGHDDLFAAGDCATLIEHPETPKAGVYAVRQGPYVGENLVASLSGGRLKRYRPQGDFLTLLNLGDNQALGFKWGWSFGGGWVVRLKDRIDRRFMHRFQVLEADGAPTAEFAGQPAMAGEAPMLCGGCAAKLGQGRLEEALRRLGPTPPDASVELGIDSADDVAAWRLGGGRRSVVSIDAFRAFTDDPYLVGRVGAVNALSDLWAKGIRPRWALALVALPETAPGEADEEELYQVLAGARSVLDATGVSLVGGHTTTAAELMVGFTVEGIAEQDEPMRRLDGLRPGQSLVLTKPLGIGVLFHADMEGGLRGSWFTSALAAMERTNAAAASVATAAGASGATDVTGFGLAGHLAAMARASGVTATLVLESLPALPGALELLGRGVRSTFHAENSRLRHGLRIDPAARTDPRLELLFDPQTSGGLLFGVDPESADEAIEQLHQAGDERAVVIGESSAADGPVGTLSVRSRW